MTSPIYTIYIVVFLFSLSETMVSLSDVKQKSCVKLDPEFFGPCVQIGYTHTFPLPAYVDVKEVSEMLHFFRDEVTGNCSSPKILTDTIHCTMLLPLCVEEKTTPVLPCRQVCADALQGCSNAIKAHILNEVGAMCTVLPDSNAASRTCFEPKGYNSSALNKTDVSSLAKCHKLVLPYCRDLGYNHTYLSNDSQAELFKELFNQTLENVVNQTNFYELKFINETKQSYPKCASILKKMICTEEAPPCYPDETKRFYGLCKDECQRLHELCPEYFESHPAGKTFCSLMADGTAAHGFCGYTKWPEDHLHWARKVRPLASQSKKLKPGVITAAVIVPVAIVILVFAAVFIWRRYGVFLKLRKGEDFKPVMQD